MTRGVYPFELSDPDFVWLLENFRENHKDVLAIEQDGLPVTLVRMLPCELEAALLLPAPHLAAAEAQSDFDSTIDDDLLK